MLARIALDYYMHRQHNQGRHYEVIVVAVICCLLAGFYLFITWQNLLGGSFSDGVFYLFGADVMSPWGNSTPLAVAVHSQGIPPPMYSLLLALFGAGSQNIHGAHLITTVTLLAALVAYYLWMRVQNLAFREAFFLSAMVGLSSAVFLHNVP